MKVRLLTIFLLTPFFTLFGQESESKDVTELKENIHLHLNKTTFLQGERLWFRAYVQDQQRKLPSLATTNLHVGIYDESGEEVKRKLVYVENGMSQGDFAIDSTLTGRDYTVLAWTNYMRNFEELEPFRQRITILRDGDQKETGEVEMGISVYPEGGDLIAGAYNNIGILVDNGLGQGVSVDNLELVDGTGKVIRSNIKTNLFGMGKTGFMVEAGKTYYLQRRRPGLEMVRSVLPRATTGRLGLNIENNGRDQVLLKLVASKETFDARDGDVHTMALYQDDFIVLEDIEVNEDEPVVAMARDRLPHGVLTAVLFDGELRPIAHRMFFNHSVQSDPQLNVAVEYCLSEFGDSIQVDLILPKGIEGEANVSLSALPGGSLAHAPDNSLVSAFTLRPYTAKGFQDGYYFQGQDRKKRFELDKRLLIEGWGSYDWDSRNMEEVREKFKMENGISFQGKVVDADLNAENQISLVAESSAVMDFVELRNDKSFNGNMKLFKGDSIALSLIGKKGKLRKPQVELQFKTLTSDVFEVGTWLSNSTMNRQQDIIGDQSITEPLNIGERIIALEEVTVTEKKIRDNKFQISATTEGRIIGDVEIERYASVVNYIKRLGFGVYGNEGRIVIRSFKVPQPIIPVFINGNIADPSRLMGMPLSRVRYLTYARDAFIALVLNDNYIPPNQRNKYLKFAIEKGYARPQAYFVPNYPDYSSLVFEQYGALWWNSSITIDSDIPTSMTIPNQNQDSVQLYLEGMSQDGSIISHSEHLNLGKE